MMVKTLKSLAVILYENKWKHGNHGIEIGKANICQEMEQYFGTAICVSKLYNDAYDYISYHSSNEKWYWKEEWFGKDDFFKEEDFKI